MPASDKKFVMKHVSKNVMSIGNIVPHWEQPVIRCNVPWKAGFFNCSDLTFFYLECAKSGGTEPWSIYTNIEMKLTKTNGQTDSFFQKREHNNLDRERDYIKYFTATQMSKYLINGSVTAEFLVTINEMERIPKEKLRRFDSQATIRFSDVLLIVGDEKFYVNKMFLAMHSTYFDSLLLGNFEESGKTEIELKDIDADDFQNFLELIHGDSLVNDDTVDGLLHLADFFDSKTVTSRCEEFLLNRTNRSLTEKITFAVKYNIEKLKIKCLSEISCKNDIQPVIDEISSQVEGSIWKDLLLKSLEFK